MWTDEILKDFSERIKNITVFAPLLDLKNKTKYDYSLVELGISTMLFILEDMLRGEKDCTYRNIAYFLIELIKKQYNDKLNYEKALELTYYIVRDCLMNQGQAHSYSYEDLEKQEVSTYKYHLIELEDYNIEDKIVRLKLTTTGLELLFKTKEMYNELQVSISQLYLRQQIQKGVFDGALRSVEELALAVKNEKNKIKELEEKIIRDVLLVAREEELENQLLRINDQLDRESRVFTELKELIEYTLNEYRSGGLGEKEREAIEKILKIRKRLQEIVTEHESLFTDKINIQQLMNHSIESMIVNSFSTKINFETELLQPLIHRNLNIINLKNIINPLFKPAIKNFFHPGRIFSPQVLRREQPDEEEDLWQLTEEQMRKEEEIERTKRLAEEMKLTKYFNLILHPLLVNKEVKLSKILNDYKDKNEEEYLSIIREANFYSFIINLHQMGKIPILKKEELQITSLDQIPMVLLNIVNESNKLGVIKAFELIAIDDIIRLPIGYVISDFIVRGFNYSGVD
ncbi:hypothetical protein [Natronospora cellulosivora (SeqCode)]